MTQEFWYRYSDPWTAGEPPYLSSIPVEPLLRDKAREVEKGIGRAGLNWRTGVFA